MKVHKSVWASIISLILCFTMFLGTTLAWFTDTVTNTNNRIVNGTLDVQLWMDKARDGSYVDISNSDKGDIFSEATGNGVKWEPGKTEIVFLAVANEGNLALNYNIIIDVTDLNPEDGVDPSKALEYAIIDGWKAENFKNSNVTWSDFANGKLVVPVQTGPLTTGKSLAAEKGALVEDGVDYFALAVHMDEDAGNEYMGKELNIDVQVAAKQMASEYDSISNQYDANAKYDEEKWHVPVWENVYENDFEEEADQTQFEVVWDDGATHRELAHQVQDYDFYAADAGVSPDGGTNYFSLGDGYAFIEANLSGNPMANGKEYVFSALVKISKDVDGNLPAPQLDIRYKGLSPNVDESYVLEGLVEDEWVEVSYSFTAPNNAEASTQAIRIRNNAKALGNGEGVLEIDNIRIFTDVSLDESTEDDLTDEAVFRAMLAEEAAVSQMVKPSTLDVWEDRDAIPGATNLLLDGDFAIGTVDVDGESKWLAWDAFENHGKWVDESHTDDESGALQLTYTTQDKTSNPAGRRPWFYQEVNDATTDVVYTISYWYKIKEGTTGGPYIKIETFPDPSIPGADKMLYDQIDIRSKDGTAGEAGVWHQVKKNFVISEGADRIRVLLRLWDDYGDVLIDDVELYATKPVDMLTLETEHKFYYDDELGNTTFEAKFRAEYFPEYADATVDFEVYDGDTLVWKKNDNNFSEGVATADFPLSTLMKREVPYCVKITMRDTDGKVLDEASENIFVYSRPEYLTTEGVFMKDGKEPFYPFVAYHADMAAEHFAKSEEGGFNVIELNNNLISSERALEQLDLCKQEGVMGLICFYINMKPAGHTDNIQWTIEVLSDERVINHEALYGYVVMDEPFLYDPNAHMDMENSYRLIKQYDSKHPIIALDSYKNMKKCIPYADIYIGDFYRKALGGAVYDFTKRAVDYANGRPVYTILEAYAYSNNLHNFPTPSDARNNVYQTLIAGAKATGFFGLSDGYCLDLDNKDPEKDQAGALWDAVPDFWYALSEFGNVEMELAYDHFVHGKSPVFNQRIGSDDYWYSSWVKDGSVYMVVMGMKDYNQPVNAEISLTSSNDAVSLVGGTVEIIADGTADKSVCNAATIENGVLKLNIKGVDTVLLKITPDGTVDFSAVQ